MSIVPRCRVIVALLLSTLTAAGCHDARRAIGDATLDGGAEPAIAVAATGGSAARLPPLRVRAIDTLQLPADFPDDVFVPASHSVNSVLDSGAMQVVSLQAHGRVSSVFADARRVMHAQGWTQTLAKQNGADSAMLSFEKDNRAAVLSFDRGQDDRDVTMSVQLRRAQ